ncbi:hypothetical protein DFQ26_003953 [Actinomortierella ambigua]|nr:hypothetical protein DFQ26_003953 [Actinomortierella ambigua]
MGATLSRSPVAFPLSDQAGDREDEALLEAAASLPHRDYGTTRPFQNAPTVTTLIKETRFCIVNALDTSLTKDELGSLEIYLALLLPIVRTYREERHESAAVYCFLLNRWQFLKEAEQDLANARLNETRLLKAFSMRQLIEALTCDLAPIRKKDTRHRLLIPRMEGDASTEPMSALEVAIEGKAKHFLSNQLVQEVVNQLWLGNIVYFAQAIDEPESCINATQHELRAVTLYDNSDIRFCRLSRLRVPRYKTTFQFVSLATFVAVYTYVMVAKVTELNAMEVIMNVFAVSYGLDELTQLLDTGAGFYFVSVWNFLDLPLYCNFVIVLILRIVAAYNKSEDLENFAFDLLACNSTLLWPRLFAALDHYRFFGTMMVVLRQMLIDCALWIALSLIFYVGFLQAFYALHDNTQSYGEIAWLLLQVFLGSAFEGFEEADDLGTFGRPLMVFFVAVSAVFLYTLLISIFSQTFSEVSANAKEEFMFLFSLKVMEEVKSDEIYEFQPPFNIMAGIIIWPSQWIFGQYTVGRINRALLRFFYFPELVFIWVYEMVILRKQPQYLPTRPSARHGNSFPCAFYTGVESNSGGSTLQRTEIPTQQQPHAPQPLQQHSYPLQSESRVPQHSVSRSLGADSSAAVSSSVGLRQADESLQHHPNGDDSTTRNAVMSPSIESIQRLRGASSPQRSTTSSSSSLLSSGLQRANNLTANGGASRAVGITSGQNDSQRLPSAVSTQPPLHASSATSTEPSNQQGPYSYYPMFDAQHPLRGPNHPIRQQSLSGYGHSQFGTIRRRQGTEATLASTFQSGILSRRPSHQQYQGPGGVSTGGQYQAPAFDQMSFRDGFADDGDMDGYGGDMEDWLGRMVDSRFDEMRERMDMLDQKLDAIMNALGISA